MVSLRFLAVVGLAPSLVACGAQPAQGVQVEYKKLEFNIPMRDGVKLYTSVMVPTNASGKHPILLQRTPYSAGPYGTEARGRRGRGKFADAGYIIATQDVRGRFMSEGKFEEIRPLRSLQGGGSTGGAATRIIVDESTDMWDTAEFLIKNVPDNNGNIGVSGVSYPGFYAACAGANTHPAVKAVSPQAPVAEWFFGDDVHHNGAFYLQDNFDFYFGFGYDKDKPAPDHPQVAGYGARPDSYKWFLEQGSPDMLEKKYFQGKFPFWRDIIEHPSYDDFWKARSTPQHLKNVKCAVLTVGGLFDAEDIYGPWDVYAHVEKLNPGIWNCLVVGPWSHGGWGGAANRFGGVSWGSDTGTYFRDEIEFPFFESFLRGDGKIKMPDVRVFNTGANQWREFAQWPPKGLETKKLYLNQNKKLAFSADQLIDGPGSDAYVSDPKNPVPYMSGTLRGRNSNYMIADQTFASQRPDVLTYQSEVLTEDITIAGPIFPDLHISADVTDLDLVAKVIDVYPTDDQSLANQQILVRADPMPVRFRESFEKPKALTPGKIERVRWRMPDVMHTFKKGHRIMVQVQSSWFPLVALNPQTFGNPYKIPPSEWKVARVQVYRVPKSESFVEVSVLK